MTIREQLLDRFHQMLRHQEYSQLSITELLTQQRLGRTTFYRYFNGKLALMVALHQRFLSSLLIEADCPAVWLHNEPPPSLLQLLARFDRRCAYRRNMAYKLGKDRDQLWRALEQQLRQRLEAQLRIAFSEVQLSQNYPVLASALVGIYLSQLQFWLEGAATVSSDEVAGRVQHLTAALIRGCLREGELV